jgi:hypothetical protein
MGRLGKKGFVFFVICASLGKNPAPPHRNVPEVGISCGTGRGS